MAQKTVLIVDDEPDILELLAYNLRKESFTVLQAHNGKEAVGMAIEHLPDVIVLDIMMPEMDGFEACKAIRANATTSTIPVIFLTAKAGEIDEILGLELGADDYIQKPVSPRLLVSRIKARIRRPVEAVRTETIAAPELLKIDALEINRQNYTVRIDGVEHFFPKKEFELLAFLAVNPDKIFDREFLLRRIWGESVQVIERTVDVHISKIREKLGKHNSYIETVKGLGYRFTTDVER
ncbi:MAG: response regulator transcription factor [Ignavibacteria bacterium]|nr:response regulator transcription factor [Ignavibacteria bacterium]MBL7990433.1 response regulator transcription factor [Candidatus Kapabacteria bacterium]